MASTVSFVRTRVALLGLGVALVAATPARAQSPNPATTQQCEQADDDANLKSRATPGQLLSGGAQYVMYFDLMADIGRQERLLKADPENPPEGGFARLNYSALMGIKPDEEVSMRRILFSALERFAEADKKFMELNDEVHLHQRTDLVEQRDAFAAEMPKIFTSAIDELSRTLGPDAFKKVDAYLYEKGVAEQWIKPSEPCTSK